MSNRHFDHKIYLLNHFYIRIYLKYQILIPYTGKTHLVLKLYLVFQLFHILSFHEIFYVILLNIKGIHQSHQKSHHRPNQYLWDQIKSEGFALFYSAGSGLPTNPLLPIKTPQNVSGHL